MSIVQDRQHTNKLKYSYIYYYLTFSVKQSDRKIFVHMINLYAEPTKSVDEIINNN